MTYNIGGGRRDFGTLLDSILDIVRQTRPDVLALQEAISWLDAENHWHSSVAFLADVLGNDYQSYFGATVSLKQHFHSGKSNFIQAISDDLQDWQFGNALLTRSGFARIGDPGRNGNPYNLPLFRPAQYLGNRDTDPRHVILTRLPGETIAPVILATHLTTLIGERGAPEEIIPGKPEQARSMRTQQIKNLLDVLAPSILQPNEVIFFMGDLNATPTEECMEILRQAGFYRLVPNNEVPSHEDLDGPVDHILMYPASRLVDYRCWIIDTPLAQQASDHLPVVADVTVA